MGMSVMSDVTLVPQKSDIWWVFLLQGFAGIIIGLMLITEPGATLVALTTVLGFYWLITGVLALVQVFVDRATPWIWSLLAGLVGILAGLFVLRHPLVAALTVPTVLVIILGIQGLVIGAVQIIGGFKGGGIGPFILGAINILVGILLLGSPLAAALAVPLVFGVPAYSGRGIDDSGVSRPRLKACSDLVTATGRVMQIEVPQVG
jgi:uncharacterized membrane protein HdeD (DUF308 family)